MCVISSLSSLTTDHLAALILGVLVLFVVVMLTRAP
jgi:hypothetical protein